MSNYGIKVTRPGYDVSNAADNQLLFSSSFKSAMIYMSGVLSANSQIAHNLGYIPLFLTQNSGSVNGYNPTNGSYNWNETGVSGGISADSTYIYNTSSSQWRYMVFAVPLRNSYTAPNLNLTPATQSTISQDYGFKVSLQGNNVLTASLANLATFSGISQAGNAVRIAMVHQTGYSDNLTNGNSVSFSHNLGYTPLCVVYARDSGTTPYFIRQWNFGISGSVITSLWNISVNSSSLSIQNLSGTTRDVAYVIFKDPF